MDCYGRSWGWSRRWLQSLGLPFQLVRFHFGLCRRGGRRSRRLPVLLPAGNFRPESGSGFGRHLVLALAVVRQGPDPAVRRLPPAPLQVVGQQLDEGFGCVPLGAPGAVLLDGVGGFVRAGGATVEEATLAQVVVETPQTLVAEAGDVGGSANDAAHAVTDHFRRHQAVVTSQPNS